MDQETPMTDVNTPVNWQAEEYIQSDRGPGWYIAFVLVVLGFIAIDFFLIKSWTFSVLERVRGSVLPWLNC